MHLRQLMRYNVSIHLRQLLRAVTFGCSLGGPKIDCTQLDLTCCASNQNLILILHTFKLMAGTVTGTKTAARGLTSGIKPIIPVAAGGLLFCFAWTRQTFVQVLPERSVQSATIVSELYTMRLVGKSGL